MRILNTINPYYEMIKRGEKKYDGRAEDPLKNYWEIKLNEKILFQLVDKNLQKIENENFEKAIELVMKFSSVEHACQEIGHEELIPGSKSIEEIIEIYNSFPNYKERISQHGFIVLKLK